MCFAFIGEFSKFQLWSSMLKVHIGIEKLNIVKPQAT